MRRGVHEQAAAKVMLFGALRARGRCLPRRLERLARQLLRPDGKLKDAIASSTRPPYAVFFGREREPEPAFADALAGKLSFLRQVDQRQLVTVVAIRGDQHTAIIGQGKYVERQVRLHNQ